MSVSRLSSLPTAVSPFQTSPDVIPTVQGATRSLGQGTATAEAFIYHSVAKCSIPFSSEDALMCRHEKSAPPRREAR